VPKKILPRHEAITELLSKESISDQKLLVERLKSLYSIETNQAVVSRDLRKLGVVKKQVHDRLVYELPATDSMTEILKLAIIDISHNESMIVIHTHPALAGFVGDCIDYFTDLEMLGCLAGENIVFVAPKSTKKIKACYQAVCKRLHYKVSK
jgi:transcriptional regulator of arginine metabolism